MKNNPETRFQEFDEEWTQTTLSKLATRISRKNEELVSDRVLTISAQYAKGKMKRGFALRTFQRVNSISP